MFDQFAPARLIVRISPPQSAAVMVQGVTTAAAAQGLGKPVPGADFPLDESFTDAIIGKVTALIDQATKDGTYISGWESIVAVLSDAGLAWRTHIPANYVGVHQDNRSSFGVAGADAQEHGRKI